MEEVLDTESDAYLERELREWARVDMDTFCTVVMRDEQTGMPLESAPVHSSWHSLAEEHDRLLIWAAIEHGKAVPLTTPIPTPMGWTTMGALRVGDTVFDRHGKPCRVEAVTEQQFFRRVYRLRFDDGSEALADADHRWLAKKDSDFRREAILSKSFSGAGAACACGCGLRVTGNNAYIHNHHGRKPTGWGTVTTAQMLEEGLTRSMNAGRSKQYKWRIPLTAPVQYAPRNLPVHPYILGAWLGDGNSASSVLTFHEADRFVYDRCSELSGAVWEPVRSKVRPANLRGHIGPKFGPRAAGLRSKFTGLGVLNNKHIPESYLTSSEEQRRELLAGLLDTDGYIDTRGRVEFCSTELLLAQGTLELIRSLGYKASFTSGRAMLNGRDIGQKYRVWFTPGERPVFKLPRKAARQRPAALNGRATYKSVVAIEEAPSVPVKCIKVDSPDSSYLMGHEYTVTHNSTNLSVARPLWLLGNDPTLRIAIVSNTARQAEKLMRSISRYVESSAELHSVFPGLRKGDQWTSSAITVKRPNISKDPSIQCLGVHGNITGARLDYVIIDDLLDVENTRTAKAREDCFEFIQAKLLSRLTARGRVLVVGTAFHPDDALHRMARLPGWKAFRYPVLEDDGQTPRWPERWPMERIARRREELGPLEFARQLLCVARDDSEARFKKEWIDRCLARGDGKNMCYGLDKIPPGYKTYTGVDLAVQQKDGSDFTVLFTIAVAPNGDREVLNVDRGKWSGPDIVARIVDTHRRYQSIVMVENNGAQDFILQFAKGAAAVPLRAFTTGRQKVHPEFGVESLAAEMAAGRWVIPSMGGQPLQPAVNQWIQEMLFYSPTAHTGDCLMGAWFAREAARQGDQKVAGFSISNMAR